MENNKHEQILQDVIGILNERIRKVEDHIRMISDLRVLDNANYICYYPGTFVSVAHDDNGKVGLTASTFPEQYTLNAAEQICLRVSNGFGERPIMVTAREYYPLFLEWMKVQLTDMERLREGTVSEVI